MGRFINADSYVATSDSLLDYNMFVYCGNNPVMGNDPTGNVDWGTFFSGAGLVSVGVTACVVAATIVSGGACVPLLVAAGATFVAGGMTIANGTAEVIESTTGYNYMRDGVHKGDAQYYEAQKVFFETAAEVGSMALSFTANSPSLCFVAGTAILTAVGTQAIETIEEGDYVWAWDEETGDVALKEVVETYVNETDELIHVFVNGEEIVTTPAHPFYSPVKGWTEAIHLRAGDILVLVNGEYVIVEKVQHEILESPVTVYNFQVADYHTYFVANTGVLVHNRCENHHILSNKNKTYTPQFTQITDQFDLKLNDAWNIIPLQDHHGRHTNAYHEYVLEVITEIASRVFDQASFLKEFQILVDALNNNPRLPYT